MFSPTPPPSTDLTTADPAETPVMPERYRAYLVFGAPGSGKGTQGKALGGVPRFFHCACGDVFRSLDTRSKLGKAFLLYSSRGELVPDELSIELWKESIVNAVEGFRFKPDLDHLVLDGIPRNVSQARLMESHIQVEKVFHLSCPDRAQLVARLKKRALRDNRLDDANEAVIRRRLETYEAETKPVLDLYGAGLVHVVDATQNPARVLWEILGAVVAGGSGVGDAPANRAGGSSGSNGVRSIAPAVSTPAVLTR